MITKLLFLFYRWRWYRNIYKYYDLEARKAIHEEKASHYYNKAKTTCPEKLKPEELFEVEK